MTKVNQSQKKSVIAISIASACLLIGGQSQAAAVVTAPSASISQDTTSDNLYNATSQTTTTITAGRSHTDSHP